MSQPSFLSAFTRARSGLDLVLTLRAAPGAGRIRVRERIAGRPVLARIVASLGTPLAGGPHPFMTAEGEYGVVLDAAEGFTLAYVFGDEHHTRFEAQVHDLQLAGLFRRAVIELAHAHELGLGSDRCRRFPYTAPAGWAGVARVRETMWISPSCARQHQVIRAYDARPVRPGAPRRGIGEPLTPASSLRRSRRFRTAAGLDAQVATFVVELPEAGKRVFSDFIASDDKVVYAFRLESAESCFAEASKVFAGVVSSMQPLGRAKADATIFAVWGE